MSAPFTELQSPLEEASLLCRGCLAVSGEMKDMFEWGLADDFYKVTSVKVDQSEVISQLLCTTCEDSLRQCKLFRSQCAQSNSVLHRLVKETAQNKSQGKERIAKLTLPPEFEPEDNATSCIMYNNQLIIMITAADTKNKIYLPCPYECDDKYMKKHDLFNHLLKKHGIDESFTIDLQYYCTYKDCSYHLLSQANKWFSGRKYLNQHYNKVHKIKIFSCSVCRRDFATESELNRHTKTCNMTFVCDVCEAKYNTNEKLMVHLMRKHPEFHRQYKIVNKANKRKARIENESKKAKTDSERFKYICDSPKRSFATQTKIEDNIKNDVSLVPWISKSDFNEAKTDEISTQTVFEDLLSIKSQTSEDESIFFSETVSLSDIQTQTFPLEFGLSRSNKETITSETQSPDLSIKETQTCVCLYDSPRHNYRLFDSVSSSPTNISLTSTETQTGEARSSLKSDVLLSFNSAQTQTSFKEDGNGI